MIEQETPGGAYAKAVAAELRDMNARGFGFFGTVEIPAQNIKTMWPVWDEHEAGEPVAATAARIRADFNESYKLPIVETES